MDYISVVSRGASSQVVNNMTWYMNCCCLEDACKKIFRFCRMVAMFPLNDDCQLSLRFSIPPAIVYFLLIIHSISWIAKGEEIFFLHRNFIHRFLYVFRKLILTYSCILIVFQFYLKRDKLRLILNNFKMIDSELSLLNTGPIKVLCPIKYLLNIFVSMFLISSQLVTNLPMYWMEANMETLLVAIFINQMLAFCDLLKYSLEKISIFHCFQKNDDYTYTLRIRLYNVVEDSTKNFNDIYGLAMFFIITTFFVAILHQVYQYLNIQTNAIHTLSVFITGFCYSWFILQLILARNMVVTKVIIYYNNFEYDGLIS